MSNQQGEYEISSGNVFEDLGLEDADELFTRARLGHTVRMILKKRKLKQREFANLLEVDQAEARRSFLPALGRYYEAFLKCFVNLLGQNSVPKIFGKVIQGAKPIRLDRLARGWLSGCHYNPCCRIGFPDNLQDLKLTRTNDDKLVTLLI